METTAASSHVSAVTSLGRSIRDDLAEVRAAVDPHLARALAEMGDEANDPIWAKARALIAEYAARPAKRVRPALLLAGFGLSWRDDAIPDGLWRFAAGIELLHTFMLVHDDVADRSLVRRNGPALHRVLDAHRGDDLAVVAGDYLFARAAEVMLTAPFSAAPDTLRYYLEICRQTAAGQYLDLQLARVPLGQVSLFQTMKVAHLKTARYGFVAPLVAGAKLAGASAGELAVLERIGRLLGLCYQYSDDLIGMFGDSAVSGKPSDGDFIEGKRTFPVVAAYLRADATTRVALERLWNADTRDANDLPVARSLLHDAGALTATQRVIARSQRAANTLIKRLPPSGYRTFLQELNVELARRQA